MFLFLEQGHTDLVLDLAHSLIERMARKKNPPQVGVPQDWIEIAKSVRPQQPFNVIEMEYSDFQNWKTSNANGKEYSDFFPKFKWKEGCRWGITRTSLCQSDTFNNEDSCIRQKIPENEMRKLALNYGPPRAYSKRLEISVSKLESLMK